MVKGKRIFYSETPELYFSIILFKKSIVEMLDYRSLKNTVYVSLKIALWMKIVNNSDYPLSNFFKST